MKKTALTFLVLALLSLGMAFLSNNLSVSRITNEINELGELKYSDESKAKLDRIYEQIGNLDPNQDLKSKIGNMETLKEAQEHYVYLMIKDASISDKRKDVEGLTNEQVKEKVDAAAECIDTWLGGYSKGVENAALLDDLKAAYPDASAAGAASSEEEVHIQGMCP